MKSTMMMILALAGLGLGAASGQMVFEKSLIEMTAEPDQEEITVEFRFTVKGDKEVEIGEYDAPCTCLEARISDNGRLVWQPGESGTVQGVFKTGNFMGSVDKMIVLRMNGETEPSVKLTVRMHIPVLLEIEPKTLFWNQKDAVKSQSFKLTVNGDEPLQILELSGTNENFVEELKTIKEGREYEIVVTPKSLEERAFGLLRIKTDSKHVKHQRYQAFMAIRRGEIGE